MKKSLYFCFLLLIPYSLSAKLSDEVLNRLRSRETHAVRLNEQKIEVDGRLDETVWNSSNWNGDFIQRNPNEGSPVSFRTEFAVVYDENFLYVASRAYDPEPQKIIAILSRRDDYTESDWMYISIDSYDDNRTAFEFGLSAAGVKHDIRRYDDENMDESWDAVWDGKVQIDSLGWTAEWRIPFRELRFSSGKEMAWGLQFYREIPRQNNELAVWNFWSQADDGFVSRYGSLKGLGGVQVRKPIYLMPYLANRGDISENLVNSAHRKNYDLLMNVGGDVRYSSPLGLTLNATINPDFGQVEADPADFNLTEFETYFSEKRPFFMEGANILRYSLGFGDGDNQNNSLFYSRRIGRTPQGWAIQDPNKSVVSISRPEGTNILGAVKVTGKTTQGLSLGLMEAVTTEENAIVYYDDGSKDKSVIEPKTNYALARFQQDYNNGQTSIGGILTGVNRKLNRTGINYLTEAAYTGGLDIDHDFFDRKYSFQGAVAFSHIQGDTLAIQRAQKNASRYFNRVDAEHLEYDPQATSLSGYAMKAIVSKNEGHLRAALGTLASSPGFEINDLGFLQEVDNINQFLWMQYYLWEPTKFYRNLRVNLNQWMDYDFGGVRKSFGGNVNAHVVFLNNWDAGGGLNRYLHGMNPSYNRGGPAICTPDGYGWWMYVDSDARKNLIFGLQYTGSYNSDNVRMVGLYPTIEWRPRKNLKFSSEFSIEKFNDTWAWIGSATDLNSEKQFIWASLNQKTFAVTFRADLTISTNLSVQYYAQPYFTAGNYFDYKELADARNVDFNKRFTMLNNEIIYDESVGKYIVDHGNDGTTDYSFRGQEDFNYKQFRSNLVLRWEYMTGSVVYFVWSQGLTDYETFKRFDLPKDTKRLFGTAGDNVLMVKISQLLTL
ncbi:MAG: DUF5916 domain-containing protein [Candidatus Marinimicrobia bacterium]|nr:DUF5916 domain-containing protein [Candidatus Neomarinimicrobiota bacterium]